MAANNQQLIEQIDQSEKKTTENNLQLEYVVEQ